MNPEDEIKILTNRLEITNQTLEHTITRLLSMSIGSNELKTVLKGNKETLKNLHGRNKH